MAERDNETLILRAGTLIPSMTATAHPSQTIRPSDDPDPTLDTAIQVLRKHAGPASEAVAVLLVESR